MFLLINLTWCPDQESWNLEYPIKHCWLNNNKRNDFSKSKFRVDSFLRTYYDKEGRFKYKDQRCDKFIFGSTLQ